MTGTADIGVIGLAVMGQNLILNMNDHGHSVVAYNRTSSKTDDFLQGSAKDTHITGAHTLQQLVDGLSSPRKIMMMVRAGQPVDDTIEQLIPLLDEGDVLIDGGNSNFEDTQRRAQYLQQQNLHYIGTGVSGGEEGARHGPSIMPGGHEAAWPLVKDLFQSISAKVGNNEPCCDWVGRNGAGHFVKMVHNGIEYGDMQLICEAYHYMKNVLGMDNSAMSDMFDTWNNGPLNSYLIEITRDILKFTEQGGFVVDRILDKAGQKGTGKWTAINALDLGTPLTMIGESVFARMVSALKDERVIASKSLNGPKANVAVTEQQRNEQLQQLADAMLASKIVSYAQGYMLMRAASTEYDWNLRYGSIAMMWRGGCIIRSAFLDNIKDAFERDPELVNLLIDDWFSDTVHKAQSGWRTIVSHAALTGIPMPAMGSALAFYDSYRTERLPANLLQAQRDYFGAHTYERVDKPAGERFHTDWTGSGGDVSSTAYQA